MKKILIVVLVLAIATLATAQSSPCGAKARMKNGVKPGIGVAAMGALTGLIAGGGNGAKWGAVAGGALGYAAGAAQPCSTKAADDLAAYERDRRGPGYANHIRPAELRTYSENADLPGVWIRMVDGADRNLVYGLLGPALDTNRYALLDPTDSPDPKDKNIYFVDIVVRQQDQSNSNNWTNVYGNRGSISVNPGGGKQKYWVTVTTYRRRGNAMVYARDLSAVNMPVVVSLKGLNYNVNTRAGNVGINHGGSQSTYSVNPQAKAAEQAIAGIFNLN